MKKSILATIYLAGCFSAFHDVPAFAQTEAGNPIPDYYQEPGVRKDREYQVGPDGTEYIDPFNGMLRLSYTDVHLPGQGGLDIDITRVYHSTQAVPGIVGGGLLDGRTTTGLGWDIHFGRVHDVWNYLGGSTCSISRPASDHNPVLELPDGSRKILYSALAGEPYDFVTKDLWIADCITGGVLIKSPGGTWYTYNFLENYKSHSPVGNEAPNIGLAYHLTHVEDRNGNTLDIEYLPAASTQHAVVSRIIASDGREVIFTYVNPTQDNALLTSIRYEGREWDYDYVKMKNSGENYYFLTGVVGPEGLHWTYDYSSIDAHQPDINAGFSISRVTAPYGGQVDYTYQRINLGAYPVLNVYTTALATRTIASTANITGGTWAYSYSNEGPGYQDETTVITPNGREIYRHCGMRAIVNDSPCIQNGELGALQEKLLQDSAGNIMQRESYTWFAYRKISNQRDKRPTRSYWLEYTVADVLGQKTTERGGSSYTTAYYDIDLQYGNARQIVEYNGPALAYGNLSGIPASNHDPAKGAVRRTSTRTFHIDSGRWIIHQPDQETAYELKEFDANGVVLNGDGRYTIDRDFDGYGNVISENRYGDQTLLEYFSDGSLQRVTDPLGRVSEFSDYYRGVPRTERHAVGTIDETLVTRTVSNAGNVTSETDARGFKTEYQYDKLNRIIAVKTPRTDDLDITVSWSFAGSRTVGRGDFSEIKTLDGFGRTIVVSAGDASNRIARGFSYDVFGRKSFESDPAYGAPGADGTTYEYDSLGRLTRVEHTADSSNVLSVYPQFAGGLPGGGQLAPNSVIMTNERGFASTYHYRAFGDPDQKDLVKIDSPENVVTEIERYPFGATRSMVQRSADEAASQRRFFTLDDRHRVLLAQYPEASTYYFSYDAVGNQTGITNGIYTYENSIQQLLPSTVTQSFDNLNRLRTIDYPVNSTLAAYSAFPLDADDVSLTYDANGNVTQAARGGAVWEYVYDANENLRQETLSFSGQQYVIQYEYNTRDALAAVVYPDGLRIDYSPNTLGWPTQATGFVDSITYHPTGQINLLGYANGISTTINLTPRLFTQSITAGANVTSLSYVYQANGNVSQINDALEPGNSLLLDYDGLDRLVSASGPWGSGSIGYDALDNIIYKHIGTQTLDYHYGIEENATLLQSITGGEAFSYAYDVQGNMSPIVSLQRQYRYNQANNLVAAAGGNNWSYDANNRRVSVFLAGQQSRPKEITLYNKASQLLYEISNQDCAAYDYVRLGAMLIARRGQKMTEDSDNDQMPDCYELNVGLDPNANDAQGDEDLDGLHNIDEYLHGTDVNNPDTDGDRMQDGYEVDNGLNPLVDDAQIDSDNDGYINLREYEAGTPSNDQNVYPASVPGDDAGWTTPDIGGAVQSSVAVAADGKLYIGSNDNKIHAYNAAGTHMWAYTTGDDVGATPVVGADGTIYVGSRDSTFYALNPDGTLLWQYPTGGPIGAAAALGDNGLVYVASEDGYLYAFNADGSPDVDANQIPDAPVWSIDLRVDAYDKIVAAPAIGWDGTIYAGSHQGQLYALRPDGSIKWVDVRSPWIQGISIGRGDIIHVNAQTVRRAYSMSGDFLWEFDPPGNTYHSSYRPASVGIDGTAYVTDGDGALLALSSQGKLLWKFQTSPASSMAFASPAIAADGTIYIGAENGELYALHPEDGSLRWTYPVPGGGAIKSSPVIAADGTIYVGSENARLNAITGLPGGAAASAWPMLGHNAAHVGNAAVCAANDVVTDTDNDQIPDCFENNLGLQAADPADATRDDDLDGADNLLEYQHHTQLFARDSDGDGMDDRYEIDNQLDPANDDVADDKDSDGVNNFQEYLLGFAADNPASTPVLPTSSTSALWSYAMSGRGVGATPAIDVNGRIFVSEAELYGATETHLHVVDANGNALATPVAFPGEWISGAVIDADGTIYVGGTDALYALNPDLSPRWTLPLNVSAETHITRPAIGPDGTIYVTTETSSSQVEEKLFAVTPAGTEKWSFAFGPNGDAYGSSSIGPDGSIYLVVGNMLYALRADGSIKWSYTLNEFSEVAIDKGTIYLANR